MVCLLPGWSPFLHKLTTRSCTTKECACTAYMAGPGRANTCPTLVCCSKAPVTPVDANALTGACSACSANLSEHLRRQVRAAHAARPQKRSTPPPARVVWLKAQTETSADHQAADCLPAPSPPLAESWGASPSGLGP